MTLAKDGVVMELNIKGKLPPSSFYFLDKELPPSSNAHVTYLSFYSILISIWTEILLAMLHNYVSFLFPVNNIKTTCD